jgi:simple sugar transport system ATP-binding protein
MTVEEHGTPALEVRALEKAYGAVRALRGVSFTLRAGEVLGLVGDNGAGKSTLVKCISGTLTPDAGEIVVDGKPVELRDPQHAKDLGIETVHQELALIETLDVVANLFLNREVRARGPLGRLFGWMDRDAMQAGASETLGRLEIRIPSLRAPVAALSGGQRQAIAVGRAVAWGRHIVLLDEPAGALGVEQASHVLELTERLCQQGFGVVLVSHNMQHVLNACSRVVVLRHGDKVADTTVEGLTAQDLVGLITGGIRELRGVGS